MTKFNVNQKQFFLIIIFIFCIVDISSFGKKETGEQILIGQLKLVGNEPFSKLVIQTKDKKNYILPKEYKKQYRKRVGQQIEVKGEVEVVNLISADKKFKITELHLKNISSIKVLDNK